MGCGKRCEAQYRHGQGQGWHLGGPMSQILYTYQLPQDNTAN